MLLEVTGIAMEDDSLLIIHAMKIRAKYRNYLES